MTYFDDPKNYKLFEGDDSAACDNKKSFKF